MCNQAIESYTINPDVQHKFGRTIEKQLSSLFDTMTTSGVPAMQLHLECYKDLRPYVCQLKTNRTCLTCIMRTPEKVLTCGHSICDNCLKVYGSREYLNSFQIRMCPLCDHSCDQTFRVIPSTAGVRLLSVDGGGIRGIIPIIFLRQLESNLEHLGCPLGEYFDLVCGTSAGLLSLQL